MHILRLLSNHWLNLPSQWLIFIIKLIFKISFPNLMVPSFGGSAKQSVELREGTWKGWVGGWVGR